MLAVLSVTFYSGDSKPGESLAFTGIATVSVISLSISVLITYKLSKMSSTLMRNGSVRNQHYPQEKP